LVAALLPYDFELEFIGIWDLEVGISGEAGDVQRKSA